MSVYLPTPPCSAWKSCFCSTLPRHPAPLTHRLHQCSGTLTTRTPSHICPPVDLPVLGQSLLMSSAPRLLLRTVFSTSQVQLGEHTSAHHVGTPGPLTARMVGRSASHLLPMAPCSACHEDAYSSSSPTNFFFFYVYVFILRQRESRGGQ